MIFSLRKRIAAIVIDIFFIFSAVWIFGQLVDEINRKSFLNGFNMLVILFPFIALFLYFKIFNLLTTHSLILQAEKRKVLERCYVIALALPLVLIVFIPFTLGLSLLFLPTVIPMSIGAMLATWMVIVRSEITVKKGLVMIGLSAVGALGIAQGIIQFGTIFRGSPTGDSFQSEEASNKSPMFQEQPWLSAQRTDKDQSQDGVVSPLWREQVLGRFVEPTYDDALINNVLVLNDVVEQYWKKNSKLPAHSEELTVFVPSLIPRYNNVSEKSQKIGWFYGILYRKMTEREYELCGKFKNTPSDIDSFGSWQYISGLHCLQRKL